MKAKEFLDGKIKNPHYRPKAWVKAYMGNKGKDWWHIHEDEELPNNPHISIIVSLGGGEVLEVHFDNGV